MTEQENIINEFSLYLEKIKDVGKKARGNYLSWARYLMKTHDLLGIRTEEDVTHIIEAEKRLMARPNRQVYKTKRDLGNFSSTLKRFLPFIQCYICKQDKLRHIVSVDEMINLLAEQDNAARAQIIDEAIRILSFERNIPLSEDQKLRMKTNMARFGNSGNLFIQNFGSGSNPQVTNY